MDGQNGKSEFGRKPYALMKKGRVAQWRLCGNHFGADESVCMDGRTLMQMFALELQWKRTCQGFSSLGLNHRLMDVRHDVDESIDVAIVIARNLSHFHMTCPPFFVGKSAIFHRGPTSPRLFSAPFEHGEGAMRMFDVPLDETSLRCVEFGGHGNVCMLLHGLGDGWFVWEEFAGQLANQSRVLAVDLRGHGDSSWSRSGDYSFDAFAWDILALCERLKLRHITLVGHSAGAGVALRIAERRPDLVRALVLVDFGPLVNMPDERVSSTMCERFGRAARVYASASEYVHMLRAAHPFVYESLLDRIAHFSLRLRAGGRGMELKRDPALTTFFEACRRTGDASSLWYLLAQTMCPTLVVRGEVSGMLPADVAEKMVSTLPQGHYVEVSFAAHSVMLDNPEDFAGAVLPFLVSRAVMPRRVRVRLIKPQKNETPLNSNQHWPGAQENAPAAGSHLQNPG